MYLKIKTKYSRDMLKHLIGVTGKKDGVIAEAGPGLGHFAFECKKIGFDYVGMEPSPTLREALTDKGLKMYDNYVPPILLRDKECDIFYACMLLEHLPTYNEAGFFMSELNG